MKRIVFICLYLISGSMGGSAHADAPLRSQLVSLAGVADLHVEFDRVSETPYEPFQMNISISCANFSNLSHVPLVNKSICGFEEAKLDLKTGTVRLVYFVSLPEEGPGRCNGKMSQTFQLPVICEALARR